MRLLCRLALVLWLFFGVLRVSADDSAELDSVRLQLKWRHQFQFAGYYAAIEKGFYREEGLRVELIEPGVGQSAYDRVLSGEAEFGVSNAEIVKRVAAGEPLVQLAVIYQHSPLVLLSVEGKGVQTLHDLVGRTMAIEPSSADLLAFFEWEGIDLGQIRQVMHDFSVEPLIRGEVDAISAYVTDEPFTVRQRGFKPIVFSPRSYGIDFYGDGLFTTRKELEERPERVAAFRRASLRGWEYALQHPGEIIDLILDNYSKRKTRAELEYEAEKTFQLVRSDLVPVGYMNPGRWAHIARTFHQVGLIDEVIDPAKYLYPEQSSFPWRRFFLAALLPFLTGVGGAALAVYYHRSKRKLETAVKSRNLAIEQLRQSERFYRDFFESAPLAFVYWDKDLIIRRWNAAAEQVFGWRAEEAVGCRFFDLMIPDSDQTKVREIVEHLKKEGTNSGENWNTRKDGSRIWCHWHNVIKYDSLGELLECQSIALDATGQYERERRLAAEKNIAEMANASKGEYLSSVSHEIRNPLSAIVSLAELLQEEAANEQIEEMAKTIAGSGESLIRILNDLIDHEKLERGVIDLIPTRVVLAETLRKTVDLFQPLAKESGTTLEFLCDCPEKAVTLDTLRLQQIMSNLLSNAIKFAGGGSVFLRAACRDEGERPIEIKVEDTGVGMTRGEQARVFDRYQQGNKQTSRIFGGTGVGLAVCQKLADLMGGRISVVSQKGEGSTFTLHLPVEMKVASQTEFL